ncbi:hypothetical protein L1887_13529 [Cichorium endivia]|nr:hypothetical protein L1887_13529 [Cichorium endivia]
MDVSALDLDFSSWFYKVIGCRNDTLFDMVLEKINHLDPIWKWRKFPCNNEELLELVQSKQDIEAFSPTSQPGKWCFSPSSDARFDLDILRRILDSKITSSSDHSIDWVNFVLLKGFVFRVEGSTKVDSYRVGPQS